MSKSIALDLIPTMPLDKPNPRIDMLVHTYLSGTMIESVKSDTNLTPQQKELVKTSVKQFNLTDVDFMVDIETLGKEQDGFAPIVSIGLVPFTKDMILSKLGIKSKIDLTQYDDPKRMKGIKPHSSIDTISWWLKQPKEAQNEFIGGDSDLKQTLVVMKQLIDEFKNCMGEYEPQIYANSHDFDVTLLERWGRGLLEVSDFKFVKYYNSRCVRTVKSEALKRAKNKDDFNKYFPKSSGTKHSAFDDSISQIEQVQYCWKYVDDLNENKQIS